jgi:hypothetical protein
MTDRHIEITREVHRLVRSGINSERIVPSIVTSWPDLTGQEREFVAEALQDATAKAERAARRH